MLLLVFWLSFNFLNEGMFDFLLENIQCKNVLSLYIVKSK